MDISQARIDELKNGIDSTLEINTEELNDAVNLSFTTDIKDIKNVKFYSNCPNTNWLK